MGNNAMKEKAEDELCIACAFGDILRVNQILESSSNIDINSCSRNIPIDLPPNPHFPHQPKQTFIKGPPLKLAIQFGHAPIVKLLCSHGANVNQRFTIEGLTMPAYKSYANVTPTVTRLPANIISIAIQQNDNAILRYLCLRGANVTTRVTSLPFEKQMLDFQYFFPHLSHSSLLIHSRRNVVETLICFGMRIDISDLKWADTLLCTINDFETFKLMADFCSYSVCTAALVADSSNVRRFSSVARAELLRVKSTSQYDKNIQSKPPAKLFPMVLTRGFLSFSNSTQNNVNNNNNVGPISSYFVVLTVESVLLCFISPNEIHPREVIFLEDFKKVRLPSKSESGKTDYAFMLESPKSTKTVMTWSKECLDVWMKHLTQFFENQIQLPSCVDELEKQFVHLGSETPLPVESSNSSSLKDENTNNDDSLVQPQSEIPDFSEDDDEKLCKICFENPIDAVLLNCGHACSCYECSDHLKACPICRVDIAQVVKIFRC